MSKKFNILKELCLEESNYYIIKEILHYFPSITRKSIASSLFDCKLCDICYRNVNVNVVLAFEFDLNDLHIIEICNSCFEENKKDVGDIFYFL